MAAITQIQRPTQMTAQTTTAMGTAMAASQPAPVNNDLTMQNAGDAEEVWDEARLERSMQMLKEMHIQLTEMRDVIPTFVEPMRKRHSSPQALFAAFQQTVKDVAKQHETFRETMTSPDAAKLFERARQSQKENPKGLKMWRYVDHPDWCDRDVPWVEERSAASFGV